MTRKINYILFIVIVTQMIGGPAIINLMNRFNKGISMYPYIKRILNITAIITLAATLLLAPASNRAGYSQAMTIRKGVKAPAFKTRAISGKVIDSKKLRGKVTLIDFWATWCGPCRMEIPDLVALNKKYSKKGLVVIGISIDEDTSVKNVPDVVKYFKIPYAISASPSVNNSIAMKYHVASIPALYFIDKKGYVRWGFTGYSQNGFSMLEEQAKKLLNEK